MNNKPAIIIIAFNRVSALKRLLSSIENAIYDDNDIPLVISVDFSDDESVVALAESFEWKHGKKKIIKQTSHLGLKQHVLVCGDLSLRYDSIIVLEDDLAVSPYYYSYAKQAEAYYNTDENVAGISLYNYKISESSFYPFQAVDDGSDVYFMQVASSWGQLWTKKQWQGFRDWFSINPELADNETIPGYLHQWGARSWKKHFIHYLIETKSYFVFPRLSLTTNFEEEGTHSCTNNVFQVPLQLYERKYQFQEFKNSSCVYDAWFEMKASCLNELNNHLSQYSYDVDLYSSKKIIKNKNAYILTSKAGQRPLVSFGSELFPLETNIALNISGKEIGLYEKEENDFKETHLSIKNHFEDIKKITDNGISIIIPVLNNDAISIKRTLDSLVFQNFKNFEVILSCRGNTINSIKKLSYQYRINVRSISASDDSSHENLLIEGFKKANNQLITWVSPDSEFYDSALQDVNQIFTAHSVLTWIKGIDDLSETDHTSREKEILNHRITKGVLFQNIKSGKINFSTEGHFFKKHVIDVFNSKQFSLLNLYFHLNDQHQLNVVIKPFFKLLNQNSILTLDRKESEKLCREYAHFEEKTAWQAKFIFFILKLPHIGHESYKWYNTVLRNFPAVLRFDVKYKTFYFDKN